MNAAQTVKLIERIKVRWPSFQIHEDLEMMVEVYLEDFGPHPYDSVAAAYTKLRKSHKSFAPTIADVMDELEEDDPIGEPWMNLSDSNPDRKPDFFSAYAAEKAARTQEPEAV